MSENEDSLTSFMQSQVSEKSKDSGGSGGNSTQNALDKMKQDEENEKQKEVDEARKESKANSQKYAALQANMIKAQGKQFLMYMPFIILAIFVLLVVVTKGGDWIQFGVQFFVGKVRGE